MATTTNLLEAMPSYQHTGKTNQAGAPVDQVLISLADADLHDGLGGINRHQYNSESSS